MWHPCAVSIKEKTNAVLRRATGYSLTRESPEDRQKAIDEAASSARRRALAEERERQREKAARNKERAEERRKERQRERQLAREERQRQAEANSLQSANLPHHYDQVKRDTVETVRDWTMTSAGKINSLIEATRYVARHKIPGDIVECGVWRGGSMQTMALTLISMGDTERELHLFDTFEGMPPPTDADARTRGDKVTSAAELLATHEKGTLMWADASLEVVKEGMARIPYPAEKVHYHVGLVEDTTPGEAPEQIAILRLDTDWYTSTKHELEHLYPRLSPGGILILDDYTTWDGAKKAVDEWLEETGLPIFMTPLGGGLIAVKPRL